MTFGTVAPPVPCALDERACRNYILCCAAAPLSCLQYDFIVHLCFPWLRPQLRRGLQLSKSDRQPEKRQQANYFTRKHLGKRLALLGSALYENSFGKENHQHHNIFIDVTCTIKCSRTRSWSMCFLLAANLIGGALLGGRAHGRVAKRHRRFIHWIALGGT